MSAVHPWFIAIVCGAAVCFAGICVWAKRTKKPAKALSAVVAVLLVSLASGYWVSNQARLEQADQEHATYLGTALILAGAIEKAGHSEVRLDGSGQYQKSKIVGLFKLGAQANRSVVSIETVRRTPSGQLQPIVAEPGNTSFEGSQMADTFGAAWSGQASIQSAEDDPRRSIAAVPIRNGQGAVEALLLIKFQDQRHASGTLRSQDGILLLTGVLALLTLFGGVALVQMAESLSQARLARLEMIKQGEKIKEQMEMIAEKNQAMAASHDALAEANAQLQSLAKLDGLTGVMNHRSLMEFLSTQMRRSSVVGSPSSVILMDVDNFKSLNDQYGHIAGDEALRCIANVLRQSCPRDAGVGRYGGEEFMMVIPGASESSALAVAEELRQRIQMAKTSSRPVTVSVGVSTVYSLSKSEQTLIDEADKALYQAKRTGKNRVIHFGHGLMESA